MKNISSRIWLSSWSCRWWDRVGARRTLSPGLGVFNTRRHDGCDCPLVGLGAETGDTMSNNSTTDNSMLELKKKEHFKECLRLFTRCHWQHDSRSFFDVFSKSFFSDCLLNSNPRGGVPAEKQSSLQVQETPESEKPLLCGIGMRECVVE